MTRLRLVAILVLLCMEVLLLPCFANGQAFWSQWGRDAQHTGMVNIPGQQLNNKLADIVYDPFTQQEQNESGGELLAHYQSTLIDGNNFYMIQKTGSYHSCYPAGWWIYGLPCGPNTWNSEWWNVVGYAWQGNNPVTLWTFPTDWTPEPNATDLLRGYIGLYGWEPVFHPALANGYLYVPGAGGTIWKVNTTTGQAQSHINPFSGASIKPPSAVSGSTVGTEVAWSISQRPRQVST